MPSHRKRDAERRAAAEKEKQQVYISGIVGQQSIKTGVAYFYHGHYLYAFPAGIPIEPVDFSTKGGYSIVVCIQNFATSSSSTSAVLVRKVAYRHVGQGCPRIRQLLTPKLSGLNDGLRSVLCLSLHQRTILTLAQGEREPNEACALPVGHLLQVQRWRRVQEAPQRKPNECASHASDHGRSRGLVCLRIVLTFDNLTDCPRNTLSTPCSRPRSHRTERLGAPSAHNRGPRFEAKSECDKKYGCPTFSCMKSRDVRDFAEQGQQVVVELE